MVRRQPIPTPPREARPAVRQTRLAPRPPKPIMRPPLPHYERDGIKRFALVQAGSWGDNLISTLMFKPLKRAYPGCLIDVYTSTLYGSAFLHNPDVDEMFQYEASTKEQALNLHHVIPADIANSGYDHVFVPHPMINPDNWTSIRHPELGDSFMCAWVRALEHFGVEYDMPLETVLRLTPAEIELVTTYMRPVPRGRRNVLMETHGESGQSFWSPAWTEAVGTHLLNGKTNLFISRASNGPEIISLGKKAPGQVWFVGGLSLRSCAELFNRCDVFFSVSSGLSNACNSNWCKKTGKWFEVVNSQTISSAPIRREGKIFWHQQDITAFIEMLKSHGV